MRICSVLLLLLLSASFVNPPEAAWRKVDDGLWYAEFEATKPSAYGDKKISILKIDPKQYTFEIASAKNEDRKRRTAAQWSERKGWVAAINAGMFRTDGLTNVALQVDHSEVNNNTKKSGYGAIACFGPKTDDLPEFELADINCLNWDELKTQYHGFLQGMRMIDCNQKPLGWNKKEMVSSMVTLAQDKDGNVLFIFSRSPFSANDMIAMVLELPLNVRNMMYLEGGPESSLFVNHPQLKISKFGSFETGFQEDDNISAAWPLPNMLGIKKK